MRSSAETVTQLRLRWPIHLLRWSNKLLRRNGTYAGNQHLETDRCTMEERIRTGRKRGHRTILIGGKRYVITSYNQRSKRTQCVDRQPGQNLSASRGHVCRTGSSRMFTS